MGLLAQGEYNDIYVHLTMVSITDFRDFSDPIHACCKMFDGRLRSHFSLDKQHFDDPNIILAHVLRLYWTTSVEQSEYPQRICTFWLVHSAAYYRVSSCI